MVKTCTCVLKNKLVVGVVAADFLPGLADAQVLCPGATSVARWVTLPRTAGCATEAAAAEAAAAADMTAMAAAVVVADMGAGGAAMTAIAATGVLHSSITVVCDSNISNVSMG